SAPAVNDPFAAHAPLHSAKAQHIPEPEPAVAVAAAAGAGSNVAAAPALSPSADGRDQALQPGKGGRRAQAQESLRSPQRGHRKKPRHVSKTLWQYFGR